jgi:urea carboxylase
MSMSSADTNAAVLGREPAESGKPSATYRVAGDRAVLVEYGEMEFDLALSFFMLAVDDAIRTRKLDGLIETAPGFRSILVSYEPDDLQVDELIAFLSDVRRDLDLSSGVQIPSRLLHLPIAFDDTQTRKAVEQYAHRIRADAPNSEGGNNIDYVVAYNGLPDHEALFHSLLATEHLNVFMGFFPGLPFLFPRDPRHAVTAPKYNPTRTWTPAGAVGLGGPCWSIYPVESAGGYQLVGRTVPIYDLERRNAAFAVSGLLMRAGDRVQFHRVSEPELLELWEDVYADRYRYEIVEGNLDVQEHLDWAAELSAEADQLREARERAAATMPVP